MGTSDFDWKATGSTILPGAICDNFTSYGGIMIKDMSQTPLSEFLRYGAAGGQRHGERTLCHFAEISLADASGPLRPQLHLAEAFYQAISGPYQLLIVGDPLCRPWAYIPKVKVSGATDNYVVKGMLNLFARGSSTAQGREIDHFELLRQRLPLGLCKPGGTLALGHRASARRLP